MVNREEIAKAWAFLRENNHSISDVTIDFMKDAALSMYDSLSDDYCKKCVHNGDQMVLPSGCTGCGSDGEKRNFKLSK